ncbi:2-polyprenyl-6-methoxyphenol hydroxylase-like FAD-dependent oxidoreductase [Paraburkholderia sp. WSM4179]|nr:2-polyprenyl-6-methoxyphenol hydroxylase-like FAD-dependent oxidoreductase [Paraburkholderia sp. WSM4179]
MEIAAKDGAAPSNRHGRVRPQGRRHAVRAPYLVGVDGASSLVRRLIGQEFKGRTFAEDWLIVDARHAPCPVDHVEFICDHRRATPHRVAPGGRERWEFMLRPGEHHEDTESETRIRELLSPWGNVDDMIIGRKSVYRFHARTVDAFSNGRMFLAGDAAHITPPFVGQGLAAGLRDAANLCWKLAWVVQGRADPRILIAMTRSGAPHAKAMINLAKFMGKLVMPRSGAVALLTHRLMRDGLATDVNRIVRKSLPLLCSPISAPTLETQYAVRTV